MLGYLNSPPLSGALCANDTILFECAGVYKQPQTGKVCYELRPPVDEACVCVCFSIAMQVSL